MPHHCLYCQLFVSSIQVDTSGSVEEQAVSSMQMTGYENPTYKYFETST